MRPTAKRAFRATLVAGLTGLMLASSAVAAQAVEPEGVQHTEGKRIFFGEDRFSGLVEVEHITPMQPDLAFDQDKILTAKPPGGVSDEAVDEVFYETQPLEVTLYFQNNSDENMMVDNFMVHTYTPDYELLTEKQNELREAAGKQPMPSAGGNKTVARVDPKNVIKQEVEGFELVPGGNHVVNVAWDAPHSQSMRVNEKGRITGFGYSTVATWEVEGELYGMTSNLGWGSADAFPDEESVKLSLTEPMFSDDCEGRVFCAQLNGYRGWSELQIPADYNSFLADLYPTVDADDEGTDVADASGSGFVDMNCLPASTLILLGVAGLILLILSTVVMTLSWLQRDINDKKRVSLRPRQDAMKRILN